MEQESKTHSIESLFKRTGDYVETRIDLMKLQAVNKTSEVTSSLVSNFILLLLGIITIMLLSTGLAYYIGQVLGGIHYGFFIIGGVYLLLAVLLYTFRKDWLKTPVQDKMIREMLNN